MTHRKARTVLAHIIVGRETEDKYRPLISPSENILRRFTRENISQGYFNFHEQKILTIEKHEGKHFLQWTIKGKIWRAEIPDWVREILKKSRKQEFRIRKTVSSSNRTTWTGTVKSEGRLTRDEWQVRIPKELAVLLWSLTEDCRIFKTRYAKDLGQMRVMHLDVFEQNLAGLVIAEVESPTEVSAKSYRDKGGPAQILGLCAVVTYSTDHRHKKLMTAKQSPEFPMVIPKKLKQLLLPGAA